MHAKSYHFIIPSVAVTVAVLGSVVTEVGMAWYDTLQMPSLVPPDWVFSVVWTIVYILTAGAAFIVWHDGPKKILRLFATRHAKEEFRLLQWLFVANAVLNLGWSVFFFGLHWLSIAVLDMVLLLLSTLGMIVLSWNLSRTAAYLLFPYAAWLVFAMYLSMRLSFLN